MKSCIIHCIIHATIYYVTFAKRVYFAIKQCTFLSELTTNLAKYRFLNWYYRELKTSPAHQTPILPTTEVDVVDDDSWYKNIFGNTANLHKYNNKILCFRWHYPSRQHRSGGKPIDGAHNDAADGGEVHC